MIYTNIVVLQTLMLHTKFQGNWPSGSGEEDVLKVLSNFEHGGHLGHVTWTIYTNFCSPFSMRLNMKFGFDWPSGFGGEDVWNCWPQRRRTPEHGYTISSPCEPDASGEQKMHSALFLFTSHPLWPLQVKSESESSLFAMLQVDQGHHCFPFHLHL